MEISAESLDVNNNRAKAAGGIPPALGCGILLSVFVFGIACVLLVGALAFEGQVLLRGGQPDEIRLWLVQEDAQAGLGFSYASRIEDSRPDDALCFQNHVRFLLWKGKAEDLSAEFCRCYQSIDGHWIDAGACDES